MKNLLKFTGTGKAGQTPNPDKTNAEVIFLMRSRSYAMSGLRKEILAAQNQRTHPLSRSTRIFRQRFCRIARASAGISQEELCELLNGHPKIQNMKSLPGAYRFLPLTTEFLTDLETNIIKILEYNPYGGGLLGIGAYGVPTEDVVEVIAKTCGATRDFRRFQQWCCDYMQAGCELEAF